MISVDPYLSGYDDDDINSTSNRLQIARDIFTLRFFDDPRIEQINDVSQDAANLFDDRSLDFVYIDAGHNYENVSIDIRAWTPKVKRQSFIAGDDYNLPGVKKAVTEILPNHESIGRCWIASVDF